MIITIAAVIFILLTVDFWLPLAYLLVQAAAVIAVIGGVFAFIVYCIMEIGGTDIEAGVVLAIPITITIGAVSMKNI